MDFKKQMEYNIELYGGIYPPKPDFNDWPPNMKKFDDLCLEFLDEMTNPQDYKTYREMVNKKLEENINAEEIVKEIDDLSSKRVFCPKLYGLIAAMIFHKLSYRWCQIPVVTHLLQETSLEFPRITLVIDERIKKIFGTSMLPSVLANNASGIYDENGELSGIKYYFNRKPAEIARSEINFYSTFIEMELFTIPLMKNIADFLEKKNKQSLTNIKEIFNDFHRTFSKRIQGGHVSHVHFCQNIQYLQSWGIDGQGGTSGSQSYPILLVDSFLGIETGGFISKSSKDNQLRILKTDRNLIEILENTKEGRFDGFEAEWEDLRQSLISFRKNHLERAKNYFIQGNSFRTAAMNSEKKNKNLAMDKEELVKSIVVILKERLDETIQTKLKIKSGLNGFLLIIVSLALLLFSFLFYYKLKA